MKSALVVLALALVGTLATGPSRGAVPCFYWDEECTSSYGVDFPGNDIAISRTGSTSECCDMCKETEGCLHWVARETDDGGYTCHLKSVYGFPAHCPECTFSYTKSEACVQFCETTCHNLEQFGPAVCGTDGYTYESPCQMSCTGVSQAAPGECDSPFRDSEPFSDQAVETEGESEVEVETEGEAEAGVEVETETEGEAEVEVETETETEGETEVEIETEGEVEIEVEGEAEAEVEVETETEGEVEVETENEGEVTVEVTTEPTEFEPTEFDSEPAGENVATAEATQTEGGASAEATAISFGGEVTAEAQSTNEP